MHKKREIVAPRGRSASPVETAREAARRKKLLRFLESDEPAWKDADHPELAAGAAEWVRSLRHGIKPQQEKQQRLPKRHRK